MHMRHSRSATKNPQVEDWTSSYLDKGNLEFFGAALDAFKKKNVGNEGLMVIGLLGQRDIPGHSLRLAQSVLRWDIRPSLWSHVFLIGDRVGAQAEAVGKAPIWEVTLHPRDGTFYKPEENGVGEIELRYYQNPKVDSNAALLAIKMIDEEAQRVRKRAQDHNADRIRYNFWESLGVWQGYLWAHGARPNPLREDVPIFSSAYVEMAFEAINLDLTPGASERNSAPEHIWNAAVWWHEAFVREGHPISGYYVLRDKGCSMLSVDD
jgi:hypothetical protein